MGIAPLSVRILVVAAHAFPVVRASSELLCIHDSEDGYSSVSQRVRRYFAQGADRIPGVGDAATYCAVLTIHRENIIIYT